MLNLNDTPQPCTSFIRLFLACIPCSRLLAHLPVACKCRAWAATQLRNDTAPAWCIDLAQGFFKDTYSTVSNFNGQKIVMQHYRAATCNHGTTLHMYLFIIVIKTVRQ